MGHDTLATKYRPKTFEDVTEQGLVVEILKNMCESELSSRNFLLIGPAGTGKAQPLYSKVLTTSGFIPMGDVKVGTEVFTSKGNIAKVSGVYPQGKRSIYEITLQDRTKIRVSDNHWNIVYRYNEDKKCREDFRLITSDLIEFFESSRFKLRIDIPNVNWSNNSVDNLPIDPYLLGALLGDGSLSSGNFQFSNPEQDVVAKVGSILAKDWGMKLKKCTGENVDYNIVECNYVDHKYNFEYKGQIYSTSQRMRDKLIEDGYPPFDSSTILRICDKSARNVLKRFPELEISVSVDENYHTWVEGNPLRNQMKNLGLMVKSVDKHIPECYLMSDYQSRLSLLQGLYDTDGYTGSGGDCSFTTSSRQLSEDFAFLVRSLGIRDTVVSSKSSYTSNGEVISCNDSYTHYLKIPSNMEYCTSLKHLNRKSIHQHEPMRNIVDIRYVGEEECQCIMVDHPDHTYISDGFIPTHNTTSARIMSNMLNNGVGDPIEIDAASHSGVDSMREIVQQARTYPVVGKYKVFIVDECFTGDTRVLTDKGFKRFDSLDKTERIAQYNDDGSIKFVEPVRWIKRHHEGDMVRLYPKFGNSSVMMTPGHQQPVYNYYDDSLQVDQIRYTEFSKGDRLLLSGIGTGNNSDLTPLERLAIASCADSYRCPESNDKYSRWQIRLSKESKISRLLNLFDLGGIEWSKYSSEDGVFECGYKAPGYMTKKLSDTFDLDFGYYRANQFIDEILKWDGSYLSGYTAYFSSTDNDNADFVSAVATLAGYSVHQKIHEYDNPNHSTEYQVCMIPCKYNKRFKPRKEVVHDYSGDVYCVEVPSHKIIVQADGFTFVTGNCHSLSNAAWQSLLKTLEESPARSVFIFCTTNPEKIPATILSRVTEFQLSKISLDGIFKRLKYVLDSEISEGRDIQYEDDAVNFIAKLANGGMRDALTLLDKVLSCSTVVDSSSLTKALSLPNYDNYFEMLQACSKKDNQKITSIIHTVYDSGVNFVKWFEGFHSFVINIVTYIYLQDINQTMIPSHYQEKISKYGAAHVAVCLKLANVLLKLTHELKSTNYQKEIAITYLCR